MRFDLRRPCPKCPFRTDCLAGWLGAPRASEIAVGIERRGTTFACHETVEHNEEGDHVSRIDEQHCAGALILELNTNGLNQMARIAAGLGLFDPEILDMGSPVFGSFRDFVDRHTARPSSGTIRGGK